MKGGVFGFVSDNIHDSLCVEAYDIRFTGDDEVKKFHIDGVETAGKIEEILYVIFLKFKGDIAGKQNKNNMFCLKGDGFRYDAAHVFGFCP